MAEPRKTIIARFQNHHATEAAVRSLHRAGVPTRDISVLGRDFECSGGFQGFAVHPAPDPEERAVSGEVRRGAIWGGLFELLIGVGFFVFPQFGPLVVLGPFSQLLMHAAGDIALGALSGALSSLGLSHEEAHRMRSVLQAGEFLCVVAVDKAEIGVVTKVFEGSGALSVTMVAGRIPT
jgi:hypothetical protein